MPEYPSDTIIECFNGSYLWTAQLKCIEEASCSVWIGWTHSPFLGIMDGWQEG
ncbi:hypothetical protein OIDMADRAFT_20988 [Oidiodendron maius Zn]|uniref:Uncharacterized protein n=1 Tax=Oidiodendron maius (strain Zn) TaxID=913774 RepID=A0A0C3CBB6_OIDMZ|nr:hypothetical protein OIDMADRAFT_20988 [Oidiodendron maius Zn]